MKALKASEVIEAIENDSFVSDLDENHDAIVLIQNAGNPKGCKVYGLMRGDDKRLSALFADRIVKDENFRGIIHDALMMVLQYHLREFEKFLKKPGQD